MLFKDLFKKNLILYFSIFIIILSKFFFYSINFNAGYDTGMYIFFFEKNFEEISTFGNFSDYSFFEEMHPLASSIFPFLLISSGLIDFNFLIFFIFLFLEILLIGVLYLSIKEFFNKKTANIVCLFYSISIISFYTFWYAYYKNILGLILIFFSLFLFKKKLYFLGVLSGGILSGLHRPSFVIFGFSLLVSWCKKPNFKVFLSGFLIILFIPLFYFSNFYDMFISLSKEIFLSLVSSQTSSGSFLDFNTFIKLNILFLPFFLIGFILNIYNKKFDIFFYIFILLSLIIFFKLFFYNRVLIFLNVIFLIYSSLGFIFVFEKLKKNYSYLLLVLVLFIALFNLFTHIQKIDPLYSNDEYETMFWIKNNIETNSNIYYQTSYYAPLILGWSGSHAVGEGKLSKYTINQNKSIIDDITYKNRVAYLFLGRVGDFNHYNKEELNLNCFETMFENSQSTVLKFIC